MGFLPGSSNTQLSDDTKQKILALPPDKQQALLNMPTQQGALIGGILGPAQAFLRTQQAGAAQPTAQAGSLGAMPAASPMGAVRSAGMVAGSVCPTCGQPIGGASATPAAPAPSPQAASGPAPPTSAFAQ